MAEYNTSMEETLEAMYNDQGCLFYKKKGDD